MIAFVRKEGRESGGGVWSIVVCELHEWQEFGLVVLLVVAAVDTEVLFQGLVDTFGLSIAFRMISGGEVKVHIESFAEGTEEECETNSEPRSEVTWEGTPCLEKTWRMNSSASS